MTDSEQADLLEILEGLPMKIYLRNGRVVPGNARRCWPDVVPGEYIKGAYVINQDVQKAVLLLRFPLPVTIDNGIFF